VPSRSHCEVFLPCAWAEFLLLQLVTVVSCPLNVLYEIYIKPSGKHLINSAACSYFHQVIPDNFPYFPATNFSILPVFWLSAAFKIPMIHAAFFGE